MAPLPKLTLQEFTSTKRSPTDVEWASVVDACVAGGLEVPLRNKCFLYAESFLIEQRKDEMYYVHAWWYLPVGYPCIDQAEQNLFEWRQEWE